MTLRSRSFLYEIPVFYLLLAAAQRALWPENFAYHLTNPSPYWLGILLFGLRYGLVAGLGSGLASAALVLAGYKLAGEGYRLDDLDFYISPGLFVVVGSAIGGVADRFLHRIAALDARIEDLSGRVRGLTLQLQAQQKAQRAVEQQVVSQMSSIVTLYHGSRNLGTLERERLFTGMLDFFTQALSATKAALYVRDEGRWRLKDQRGWSDADAYPRVLDFTSGLIGKAGSERRVVSVREWFDAELAGGAEAAGDKADAIMAGPLLDPSGEAVAVFSVQAMPLLRFNSASVNLLTLLLDWGSEALAKCAQVEGLRSQSILNEELGVYNENYFKSRAEQEFDRSAHYALPFSVLLVRPGGLDGTSGPAQAALLHAVSRLVRETARRIDVVTTTPLPEAPLAVLMMTATRETALELKARLLEGGARLQLPGGLRVGVGSYAPQMRGPEELIEQARSELG